MSFNGIRKPWLYLLEGRQKAPFAPLRRNLLTVPGNPGAYLQSTDTEPIIIYQPIAFKVNNDEHTLQLLDELASWLITDEPVPLQFDDEPGRTYYAVVQNTLEDFTRFASSRKGTVQFLVLDGHSYGPELESTFISDSVIIENLGTAESDPIFELTAKEKSTFAMVANENNEYIMIGRPTDDEEEVVDARTSVLYENGSTIDTWTQAPIDMVDTYHIDSVDGVMGTDGAGIRPESYGTPGQKQRGPAVFKELPEAIQDFEIETTFDIISRREIENFRMSVLFHDENMNNLGMIGIKDNSRNHLRRTPLGRVGHYRGGGLSNGYLIGDADRFDNARETTLFYLRAKREGSTFSIYIGEWQNHRHIRRWEGTYHDIGKQWNGKLKFITLFIGSYQDRVTPSRLRMNSVEVFELSTVTEDQTPYIVYPGDVITFDHARGDMLLNGENVMQHKDFGGRFFKLKKGHNTITLLPAGSFDTNVKFRPRYR